MTLTDLDQDIKAKILSLVLVTYSPRGRARNLEFTVADISPAGITFRKQNGKEQTASRKEVDYVADHWEAVKSGETSRTEVAKKSFNTSYLFSLLHLLDGEVN